MGYRWGERGCHLVSPRSVRGREGACPPEGPWPEAGRRRDEGLASPPKHPQFRTHFVYRPRSPSNPYLPMGHAEIGPYKPNLEEFGGLWRGTRASAPSRGGCGGSAPP